MLNAFGMLIYVFSQTLLRQEDTMIFFLFIFLSPAENNSTERLLLSVF